MGLNAGFVTLWLPGIHGQQIGVLSKCQCQPCKPQIVKIKMSFFSPPTVRFEMQLESPEVHWVYLEMYSGCLYCILIQFLRRYINDVVSPLLM